MIEITLRRQAARVVLRLLMMAVAIAASARPAIAQQSMSEVLSFLLTNRSIATDDFVRDAQAAAATRDTMTRFLLAEISTLPTSSPAGGFTYRLDQALGTDVRSSASFGPFFLQRSLTIGRRQVSFGVSMQRAAFTHIDGRPLRDGTLAATSSRFANETDPFDTETLSLRLDARTFTASGTFGLTDQVDMTVSVPLVELTLQGERTDTYRGTPLLQAAANATASGLGDIIVGGKYNVWRRGGGGIAVGAEARLPTGDEKNLLGTGNATIAPRVIGSAERDRVAVHGEVAYVAGGISDAIDYGAAISIVGGSRLTVGAEVLGRRMASGGRLVESIEPHPSLSGVETIRLLGTTDATTRVLFVAGVRWNAAASWLISASVLRSITDAGLTARWVPTIAIDYSFGR